MNAIVIYLSCFLDDLSGIAENFIHRRHAVKAFILFSYVGGIFLFMFFVKFAAHIFACLHAITVSHAANVSRHFLI